MGIRDHPAYKQLFFGKSIESLISDASGSSLKKNLTALDLTMMGIGAIIGSGIFVLPGHAAASHAGPAVVVAFMIAAFVAGIAGLCYAELASIVPVAGSSYTYTYASMGELAAWVVAWNVLLESVVSTAIVGSGWSAYLIHVIAKLADRNSEEFNPLFRLSPFDANLQVTGGIINLPAAGIIIIISFLMMRGTKESAVVNSVIVSIKLVIIVVVICALFTKIDRNNLEPFLPPNTTGNFGEFGASGVLRASSMVFLAYMGFDMVATTAQECKNPQRDLPIGILSSLVICTILYILMCFVMTGALKYDQLGVDHPISLIVDAVGFGWLSILVDVAAIVGLLSVIIAMLIGPPRIYLIMSKDGLLPPIFGKTHPSWGTPWVATLFCGAISGLVAGLVPMKLLVDISSVGTLFAFAFACLAVMVLRLRRPDLHRSFTVPGGAYFGPLSGAFLSTGLIFTCGVAALIRLVVWTGIGILVYFLYARKHSRLNVLVVEKEKGLEMLDSIDFKLDGLEKRRDAVEMSRIKA